MRKLIMALILCLSLFTACSNKGVLPNNEVVPTAMSTPKLLPSPSPTTAQTLKLSDYFPYEKDIHMKYKGTGNEYAEYETFVDYIKDDLIQLRSINGGTISVMIYQLKDGVLKKVYTRGEIYHRFNFTSYVNHDEIIIKEPIVIGNSWKLSDNSTRSITAINMQVKTPAGDFDTLEITTQGKDSVIKEYYAKNMGIIKREYKSSDGSFVVTSELEKVESGVPYTQKVRFFYPDFLDNRIVYINRDIEITTNQDMKYKFQQGLKTIAEGSGLSKVLSTNTQILGIDIDEKNNTVIVDFSSHLVKEMNAGTSLESMLLKSIANTFGHYYQKDKVIITIEGNPYASGHIIMRPGEGLSVMKDNLVEFDK